MKHLIQLLGAWACLTLTLISCGSSDGPFRLEGRLRNMNQAELYIYHPEQGWKDTIAVRDGRFRYETSLSDTTTLRLLFPNFSELPIFARPGASVQLEGDASHLRETEVKGTEENEEMTGFRLRANKMMPPEITKAAEEYILEHPTSLVSFYLFDHYFLITQDPDYKKAAQLGAALLKAMPNDGRLVRMQKQLDPMGKTTEGQKLPTFTATDIHDKAIKSDSLLKSEYNVVVLWASWSYESKYMLKTVRKQSKAHPGRLSAIGICLDAKPYESKQQLRSDSIDFPIICDGLLWQSPLVIQLGFATLPSCIVTDKNGKIIARDYNKSKALEEKLKELLK